MGVQIEAKGGFFVWTKSGRAPRYRHDSFESALAEAERLAKENPGRKFIVQQWLVKVSVDGVEQMEPAMENTQNEQGQSSPTSQNQNLNTIWAGAKDNSVGFAHTQDTLTQQGYSNPTSFNVNGDINGVSFLDDSQG